MQTRTFPPVPTSVPAARRFVAAALPDVPARLCETALLLASELATNALLHSSGNFEVLTTYSPRERLIRVEVTDAGGGEPRIERPDASEEHGRGLQLVASLSDRWGVRPLRRGLGTGKTVWFELAVPDRALEPRKGEVADGASG